MTLASDIANDYLYFDGVESVTIRPIGNSDNENDIADVKALRSVLARQEISVFEPSMVPFNIWVSTLADHPLKNGDVLIDSAGTHWTIQSAELRTLQTRWRVITIKNVA